MESLIVLGAFTGGALVFLWILDQVRSWRDATAVFREVDRRQAEVDLEIERSLAWFLRWTFQERAETGKWPWEDGNLEKPGPENQA